MLDRFKHIVVEGPIGAGKTSLAARLGATLGAEVVLEDAAANPFLNRFYRDSKRYALPTQLFFLFQRVNQLRDLAQRDLFARQYVADFLLEKDPIFAQLTLDDEELKLYRQIYASLSPQAPDPDLVIVLEAPPDTLVERITRRGRPSEAAISETYLRDLCDAYTRFFYQYNAAPLLIVNTEHLNLVDHDADYKLLLERISGLRGRREHFNRVS
ncbi:MAG: deoxynucleoside kinase [Burkholderiaceae bacterium]|jgi:deoxyadenosine/deoxycytidine kinase